MNQSEWTAGMVDGFNGGYAAAQKEFAAAQKECQQMRALAQELYWALSDALEMADDYADIRDSDDGYGPRPNRAMNLAQEWKLLVERAGNFLKEHA